MFKKKRTNVGSEIYNSKKSRSELTELVRSLSNAIHNLESQCSINEYEIIVARKINEVVRELNKLNK